MERADDHHEEIAAFVRRLQEANIVDSQIDPYLLSQAPSTRERTRWDSFNRGTNTVSYTATQFGASHAFNELQWYQNEVMQRMAADREQMRQISFNRGNNTLSDPAPRSGVPQAIIDGLRSYEYTHQMAIKDDTSTCSICLGDVDIGQTVGVLTCEHEFHALCVDKWLLDHPTCPICRSAVQ